MKRGLVAAAILVVVVLAIALTLSANKKKIDVSNQPVNRTNVPVSVAIETAQMQPVNTSMSLPAVLKPYEEAKLNAQMAGMISHLTIVLGAHVTKGQVVGQIDTKLTELNLQAAELSRQKLNQDYIRAKELQEGNAGLEVNTLNAKNSVDNAAIQVDQIRQQLANAKLIAPVSGIVTTKNLSAGEYVSPGVAIATITNVNPLKAAVFVNENQIYTLKPGQAASLTADVFPGRAFSGKILFVNPKGDDNHNYQVDLVVTNTADLALKAGTNVTVIFGNQTRTSALQISKRALVQDQKQLYVYLAAGNRAKAVSIATGRELGDRIEVLSGLRVGDQVVVSGQINLRDGSPIAVINR
ncbi:efflux RND transporter periplasmic adaptor subunit [Spirosoma linguale]|uniref:Efflux transporter, RND family, MFP subunit n=1 Tax=Spirosoma linguale (strain ATCC 33905 / DSM 74 / LMG 10896 / Claus 1) TaxID=504472 RepID=D2QBY4_SPILD|nr:efflux transporter, RND family, MFP subunit [Spirosoma linguale DSM 74]